MEPGIYSGISNDAYHSGAGDSSSRIKTALVSAAHYQQYQSKDATPAMALGTAVHALVLEPDTWRNELVLAPDINRRTKAGKEEYALFQMEAAGKTVVTQDVFSLAQDCANAVHANEDARKILIGSQNEQSIYWDTQIGLHKARPDAINGSLLADLKTSGRGVDEHQFARSCVDYDYPLSLGMYHEGLAANDVEITNWCYIVVQPTPPFPLKVYVPDTEFVTVGISRYQRAKAIIGQCIETGCWPNVDSAPEFLSLPAWYEG